MENKISKNFILREFACATERHPWDVRVKVGSERKFATSEKRANFRPNPVSTKSYVLYYFFGRRGAFVAPRSRQGRGIFCAPGTQKDPYPLARFDASFAQFAPDTI